MGDLLLCVHSLMNIQTCSTLCMRLIDASRIISVYVTGLTGVAGAFALPPSLRPVPTAYNIQQVFFLWISKLIMQNMHRANVVESTRS